MLSGVGVPAGEQPKAAPDGLGVGLVECKIIKTNNLKITQNEKAGLSHFSL